MKTKLVMMGVLAAALTSTVYADAAQTQMNNPMAQPQTNAPAMPATTTAQPGMPSTVQPSMPGTANPQAAMPNPQATMPNPNMQPPVNPGAMPDTATGNADDMNAPAAPAPTPNY